MSHSIFAILASKITDYRLSRTNNNGKIIILGELLERDTETQSEKNSSNRLA